MKKKIAVISVIFVAAVFAANLFLRSIYVVPILMYHSIGADDKGGGLVVTPENFKRQMQFLKKRNYNVISLDQLADIINAKKKIPPKTACITFDDGYENNYTSAYPVLKELNLPATIFIYIAALNGPGYLTASQLRAMEGSVISIGSHTKTHFWLGKGINDFGKAKKEILESKRILEKITGKEVNFFSYPGGGFTKETRQVVKDCGYKGAVSTNPGKKYPRCDLYALKRLRISKPCNNLLVFWIESSGYYTWIKEHRDTE